MKDCPEDKTYRALKKLGSRDQKKRNEAKLFFSEPSLETLETLAEETCEKYSALKLFKRLQGWRMGCLALCLIVALPHLLMTYDEGVSFLFFFFYAGLALIIFVSPIAFYRYYKAKLENVCLALAYSERSTPTALAHLLSAYEANDLHFFTPAIVNTLNGTSDYGVQELILYQALIPTLEKHLSPSSVNANPPLAIALASFYARFNSRAAYCRLSLSLSLNYPPRTHAQKRYFEFANPLVAQMERTLFCEAWETQLFLKILPASYSANLTEDRRIAIHALAYLLPQLHFSEADFIRGDLQTAMLRYLASDPAPYPILHLAIIDYFYRAHSLDALSVLRQVTHLRARNDGHDSLRKQVSQSAETVLRELEKIAERKQTAKTLLRAGTLDHADLLRASDQAAHEEAAESLLRKGSQK